MAPQFLITKIGKNEIGDLKVIMFFLKKIGFEIQILDKNSATTTDLIYISDISNTTGQSFLKQQIELGTVCFAVGLGFAFCGKELVIDQKPLDGLGILNFHSELNSLSNLVFSNIQSDKYGYIVGHKHLGLEIFLDNYQALGNVKSGWGDNKLVKTSGIIYKNLIGINLQDNVLVNNPDLLQDILQKVLDIKLKKQQITRQFYDFSKATLNSIDDNFAQLMQVENLENLKINL